MQMAWNEAHSADSCMAVVRTLDEPRSWTPAHKDEFTELLFHTWWPAMAEASGKQVE